MCWRAAAALLVVLQAGFGPPVWAQPRFEEIEVKAAFLYNLLKFVEWPPARRGEDSLVICTTSHDRFTDTLEAVLEARKENRPAVTVRVLEDERGARACHSVFIAGNAGARGAAILAQVRGADVLTVGETPAFLAAGGLVRLYVADDRMRFQIDAGGARNAGLRISPQLLRLAQ